MSSSKNVNALIGKATRYIAGRNAVQTVYWRTEPGTDGKMMKYNKTCEFDKSQKIPIDLREAFKQDYRSTKDNTLQ